MGIYTSTSEYYLSVKHIYNTIYNIQAHKHKYTILSRVLVTETGFGLVIGFIIALQFVTTNNYL
jgi:hypothetical protein